MKNKLRLLYVLMAFALILSACGTTNTGKEETEKVDEPTNVIEETETTEEEEPIVEDIEEDEESADGKDPEETKETVETEEPEQTESEFPDKAVQVDSDAQEFSIHLLPEYTLTSEEPGRDILYLDTDGTIFMRIETMPIEDGTYDYLVENTIELLEASSDGDKPTEITDDASLPSGEAIQNAKAYTVQTEAGPVTGAVFERDDMIVRLTIFDSVEAEYFQTFMQMGETIIKK